MRVLLVEDEPKMARAVRRGLEREGYATDVVASGQDALHNATESDYDVIVLDVIIPDLDGFEVCRQLRSRSVWTPVLMLTARDAVEDRIRGLDVGADDYLVKPFSFGELLARLRALVRRAPAERPAVLSVGHVTLDPGSHVVTCAGEPVRLSAREFALLEFLMRRAGQVVTRAEILEHVWDCSYEGMSNVVDVYMGYLRKKLTTPSEAEFIRTVRGVGYAVGT
jgi:two-component system OmpR family response regulator